MTDLSEFREKQDRTKGAVEQVANIAESVGASSLHERLSRDLVKKLAEDRFHLVVVGEFNHGKSTFVNALLGRAVLPSGVTPTTASIHHIRYADAPEAFVVRSSGEREKIDFERVRSFAVGGGANEAGVDFIEVGFPAPLLRERILLVDTPGVNDLSLQRSDITYSYIPRADAVLFLLDAGQILKESERVFLEEKLLRASRDRIVFVVTKWDLLSADERHEALAYTKNQLGRLLPNPVVFPVSAELALEGKTDEGGMKPLIDHLTTFLAEERGRVLLSNVLGDALSACELLERGIDARIRASTMDAEELDRRIALLEKDLAGKASTMAERRVKIREQVAAIKVGAKKDLERFAADLTRELPRVIDQAKGDDLKSYLPSFLEETFRKWAEAETKEIGGSLEALAEQTIAMVKEDARASSKQVQELLGSGQVKRLEVEVDTLRYDAGVFALFAVGFGAMFANLLLGGLLMAAAPVLAFVVKDRVESEYRKKAKELAPKVVADTAAKVAPTLEAMIDDFGRRLEEWVTTAGEELYREVLEVLTALRDAHATSSEGQRNESERGARWLKELEGARECLALLQTEFSLQETSIAANS